MAKKKLDTPEEREAYGIEVAKDLIESRRPKTGAHEVTFRLKKGHSLLLQPKFIYTTPEGIKVKVRYATGENTIFEAEQDSAPIKMEMIAIDASITVRDTTLQEYLLLNPLYGSAYTVVDPAGEAEKTLAKFELIDEIWDEVRALPTEKFKALALLVTPISLAALNNQSPAEIKLTLKLMVEKDPKRLKEALADPVLDTLYLYHISEALGVIKYAPKSEAVVWRDTGKEICKVPANKVPSTHLARLLLEDTYLKTRELLESRLND